jgi:hypothetical protein
VVYVGSHACEPYGFEKGAFEHPPGFVCTKQCPDPAEMHAQTTNRIVSLIDLHEM